MRDFSLLFVLLCVPYVCNAQFNTIGMVDHRSHFLTKKNPSEQAIAPKDSVECMLPDSVTIPVRTVGKEELERKYMSVSWPLKQIRINSTYGMRMHPIYHRYMMHNGIDLHARHEDVLSMLPGRVVRVGYDSRSGKFVTVQTADYTVSYCHLSQQFVRKDDFVDAGDAVGMSGSTGASTGEHLHLTTKKDGKAFDPTILLNFVKSIKQSYNF
jgi:murein DD-endopeptidase MepM/ murein hydrolase activator NlpD